MRIYLCPPNSGNIPRSRKRTLKHCGRELWKKKKRQVNIPYRNSCKVSCSHTFKIHLARVAKTQCQSQKNEAAEYDNHALCGSHGNLWKRWDKAGKVDAACEHLNIKYDAFTWLVFSGRCCCR